MIQLRRSALCTGVTILILSGCLQSPQAREARFLEKGKKAFEQMEAVGSKVMATDCPLAAVHFQQAIKQRPIHPIQVLARAYRADGFTKALNPGEEKK